MQTLYLTHKAWRKIETAVRNNPFVETGGILMGYAVTPDAWVITFASGPGPHAIQLPRAIQFDDAYHTRLVRRKRFRSGGRLQYLGDWHSHTVKRLSPSRGDRLTIWQKWQEERYAASSPIMLIVGRGKGGQVQGRAFVLDHTLREVKRVELIGG